MKINNFHTSKSKDFDSRQKHKVFEKLNFKETSKNLIR